MIGHRKSALAPLRWLRQWMSGKPDIGGRRPSMAALGAATSG